jgi:hypothetical protein
MMTWAAEFMYDNGITVVIDSGGERSRPWPGGSATI